MQSLGMRPFKAAGFEEGLRIELVARRTADLLEATVVLPAVAVCVLLLAVPWLPADAPHRPLLLCTVVLLQVGAGKAFVRITKSPTVHCKN